MTELKESELGRVIQEYEEAFWDIPFGNSKFQIENFIINGAHTPERAYRAIGLTMRSKIQALKEAHYNLRKEGVDIEEMQEKLSTDGINKWEKKRLGIEIERKREARKDAQKLINDALAELSVLYAVFQKLPRYTRAQFEAGERRYFEIRLNKMALGIQGPLESLDNMGVDISQIIGHEVPKVPRVIDLKALE